jgi:flagellin-like hook-associated protein FlgL
MLTTAPLDLTSLRLSAFYRINQNNIYNNMTHVASGKRVAQPSDNAADYFYAKRMNADIQGLQQVQREMSVGSALLDSAKAVGSSAFEDLTRMGQLISLYYDPSRTSDEQGADKAEFDATRNRVLSDLSTAYYDKWKLVADNGSTPLMKIMLDPRDISQTFDITYDAGDVADPSGLTLGNSDKATEMAALQAQLDKAGSYLAKSTVYSDALAAQHELNAKKVVTYTENAQDAEGVDDGAAMMKLVRQNLCQQLAVSMLAQANMFKNGVAALAWGKQG